MATLTKANQELFRRGPDECFESFEALHQHCIKQRDRSTDLWERPQDVTLTHDLTICAGGEKPLQILSTGDLVRSVHGVAYTRLWNAELLDVVNEFASDFTPPQKAMDDVGTGLYCGEQDLFAFLIDPTGWAEIDGEAFAPGFFVWNSEVGKRSLGIQTFWFQRCCQNHIVWDATEVVEFSRKHTANVRDGLNEIRSIVEGLVASRDARRDSFAAVIKKAMSERLGSDADEVTKALAAEKIPRHLIKDAMEIARKRGAFTIFALVDALTQLSQKVRYAGDRTELDARIGQLLALAA
jgi:histone H3/H4